MSEQPSFEIKANLTPRQKNRLEKLKTELKAIVYGRDWREVSKDDSTSPTERAEILRKYKAKQQEILEFLEKRNEGDAIIDMMIAEGFITEKAITIGGKSAEELIEEIKKKDYEISNRAEEMIKQPFFFRPSKKSVKMNLVILSVEDLGFPQGAARAEIYEKAQELGLEIVPPEVGPQLRLQYEDQPMDEYLIIGSEPVPDSSYGPYLFSVNHYDQDWLLADSYGELFINWSSTSRWVFARPSRVDEKEK